MLVLRMRTLLTIFTYKATAAGLLISEKEEKYPDTGEDDTDTIATILN